ncbi:MAG: UDP-4-amino-4,6-dideoxy-N-acetyl-beta-L-altrosamine transaminase [Magnetococcales bacterium]|nr:UDP-4-amino-4,6-dideoxy-N-acetyl-beta-L-altrosamine transaminase [Magnetococcales bacterium]MBF0157185.1 UDP-4-amino-4,6-dideoxy-N-acetyl-beta-L-altrosamine transaminase [Magnetococcales bacterium]
MEPCRRPFIPYGRQEIEADDVAAVTAALRSGFLTTGPAVAAFEEALAGVVGARHATVCASGTAALHLAALALELLPGEAVIVPALTFVATANAATYVGARVIIADVDAATGLLGPSQLAEALSRAGSSRVRAVFPVHLNGQPCDLAALAEMAAGAGLVLVEDACHALGTTWGGAAGDRHRIGDGTAGALAVFSFHPVKTVTMGEGGAVTTNDPALDARMKRLRHHGMTWIPDQFANRELAFDPDGRPNPWYHEMSEPGFNYRASDLQCALGLSQLGKLPRFLAARAEGVDRYDRLIAPLAPVVQPLGRVEACRPGWHLYVVHIDFAAAGRSRAEVMTRLRAAGVGSQVHYLPLHWQPYYRRLNPGLSLPGAEAYYSRCLSLPLFPGLSEADQEYVVASLAEALE